MVAAAFRILLSTNRQAPLSSTIAASRALSTTSSFYGTPLPPSTRYTINNDSSTTTANKQQQQQHHSHNNQHSIPPLTPLQRLITLLHSSLTALNDPTRADAVAAVGEVTGSYALSNIRVAMEQDLVGRRILGERPLVDDRVAMRAFELLEEHSHSVNNLDEPTLVEQQQQEPSIITFGAAYATFLQKHNFHPNERSKIRFLSDPHLSYVMTRYRQNHDYWHVLTGLPPTVLGELALKWLELIQTGLPLAALSATTAGVENSMLSEQERQVLWEVYFPWAIRVGRGMRENALMCTYYEEELETDLGVLRERMGIEVAPCVEDMLDR